MTVAGAGGNLSAIFRACSLAVILCVHGFKWVVLSVAVSVVSVVATSDPDLDGTTKLGGGGGGTMDGNNGALPFIVPLVIGTVVNSGLLTS